VVDRSGVIGKGPCVPEARAVHERVRTQPDAAVFRPVPVSPVVQALASGPRPTGNLVVTISRLGEAIIRLRRKRRQTVVVGKIERSRVPRLTSRPPT
jgi:hypothetical protein